MKNNTKTYITKYIALLDKYKKRILPLILVAVIAMGFAITKIEVNLNTDAFLFKTDPILQQYRIYQDIFGNDSIAILAIKGDVFSNEYLDTIYKLQNEIKKTVPYISDITSLINISQIYSETTDGESTLFVDDLLADFPDTRLSAKDLSSLKETVLNDPVYRNRVVSEDGAYATILIEFFSPKALSLQDSKNINSADAEGIDEVSFDDFDALFDDTGEADTEQKTAEYISSVVNDNENLYLTIKQTKTITQSLQKIIARYNADDFDIAMVGESLLIPILSQYLLQDLFLFFPILIVAMVVLVLLLFRRSSALLFCFSVASFTNIITIGMMALLNIPISLVLNILPLILFTMSIGAVIHLISIVYKQFDNGYSKQEALSYTLIHSGWPIILTSITSAGGIFSFYFSSIKPIQSFGMMGAFGLLVALFLTIVFVPLLILILPIKRKSIQLINDDNKHTIIDDKLSSFANFSYKHRIATCIFSILLVGGALFGVKNVIFSHSAIKWLPKHSQYKKDVGIIDKVLKGSNSLTIFIDTKKENGVLEPAFLKKIESYISTMEQYDDGHVQLGTIVSFNTMIKKTNQILHDNDPNMYSIPDTSALVVQEVLLLENGGQDALRTFVDLNYRYTQITLMAPDFDAVYFTKLLQYSDGILDNLFKENEYEYFSTGGLALLTRIIAATIESAKKSYLIAFGVIFILMILLTKNLWIGIVSMIPNLLPLFILLGVIGFTPINLDMFVLLVGCVLLGIAVDNTIHFIHVFRNYMGEGFSHQEAIRNTFLSTGKAMLTASLVLLAGFGVFVFAQMNNFKSFGIMAVIGIIVALFADFLLTPALMSFLIREKKKL